MKGSTKKYVDRKCLLCSTKFVYIYIYIVCVCVCVFQYEIYTIVILIRESLRGIFFLQFQFIRTAKKTITSH